MDEKSIDFGELSQDDTFKERILTFRKDLESASELIKTILERYKYEELSVEDKVRLIGVDANQHDIKGQINRVREYMKKSKEIYEKQTKMPRLDQGAAKRFVKSGLWTPENSHKSDSNSEASPFKRRCLPTNKK